MTLYIFLLIAVVYTKSSALQVSRCDTSRLRQLNGKEAEVYRVDKGDGGCEKVTTTDIKNEIFPGPEKEITMTHGGTILRSIDFNLENGRWSGAVSYPSCDPIRITINNPRTAYVYHILYNNARLTAYIDGYNLPKECMALDQNGSIDGQGNEVKAQTGIQKHGWSWSWSGIKSGVAANSNNNNIDVNDYPIAADFISKMWNNWVKPVLSWFLRNSTMSDLSDRVDEILCDLDTDYCKKDKYYREPDELQPGTGFPTDPRMFYY